MQKKEIIKNFKNNIQNSKPLVGVATTSGFSAKQSYEGGADFILVLNAGRFRNSGISSLASLMPFENSNKIVLELGEKEILTKKMKLPIIAGLCGSDPTVSVDDLLKKVKESGFSGVTNFPTVGLIDGNFRNALEENHMGFDQEVNMIKKASDINLFTIAFVFNKNQAKKMLQAGADILCAHLGWTVGGESNLALTTTLDQDIKKVNKIFSETPKKTIKMIYGGRIKDAKMARYFYEKTNVVGYIGGSTFERIPSESMIKAVTKEFKDSNLKKESNAFKEMIGESEKMEEIYTLIYRIADKEINVLITGESGTGKELIVKAIHYFSDRNKNPLVRVNCAAIPYELLESELFGHEKGAFTGAISKKIGKFEMADGGTLFLDEIGDMDIRLQAKVLRAIQQKEFQRLGGNETIRVDVRIICATNKDLKKSIRQNLFREDLYYRLNTINIEVPPLRERKEDIKLLVEHFIRLKAEKFKKPIPKITQIAMRKLEENNWPGNIRELENIIERAVAISSSNLLDLKDFPKEINEFFIKDYKTESTFDEIQKQAILKALDENGWNRTKAADQLKITRRTLYNKLKKFEIE